MPKEPSNATFATYMADFLRYGGRRAAIALVLSVLGAALSAFGLVLIIPLLTLTGIGSSNNRWTESLQSALASWNIELSLASVLLLFVLINGAQAFLTQASTIYQWKLRLGFIDHVRGRLYGAVTRARWDFYLSQRRSDIVYALNHELTQLSQATYSMLFVISSSIVTLVYASFAAWNWPGFTLAAVLGTVVLMLPLRLLQKRVERYGRARLKTGRDSFAASEEHLASFQLAKSHGLEERELGRYEAQLTAARMAQQKQLSLQQFVQAAITTGQAALIGVLVWYAIAVENISSAELLLLIYLMMRVVPVLSKIQQQMHNLLYLIPAFRSMEDLRLDCENAAEALGQYGTATKTTLSLNDAITLNDVHYRYPGPNNTSTIRDFNLRIPAGQVTALTGPSGTGKSTVIGLALGLLSPDAGRIDIDGHELSGKKLLAWRQSVAYVPQNQYLFHNSIRSNVSWMCEDASDDAVWAALEAAAAAGFVRRLPNGLDTVVGDGGVRLSGGERQRIAIARALMRKPTLLVLDEATSELDADNEALIQTMLANLRGKLTILVVAHQESSLQTADQVIRLAGDSS